MAVRDDTLTAALAAVSALMKVIAGDPKRRTDRGQLTRVYQGGRHLPTCEIGLYLTRGSAATGGDPCSQRCLAAHEALRLGAVFLQAVIDEYGAAPAVEQLRLLDVAS